MIAEIEWSPDTSIMLQISVALLHVGRWGLWVCLTRRRGGRECLTRRRGGRECLTRRRGGRECLTRRRGGHRGEGMFHAKTRRREGRDCLTRRRGGHRGGGNVSRGGAEDTEGEGMSHAEARRTRRGRFIHRLRRCRRLGNGRVVGRFAPLERSWERQSPDWHSALIPDTKTHTAP